MYSAEVVSEKCINSLSAFHYNDLPQTKLIPSHFRISWGLSPSFVSVWFLSFSYQDINIYIYVKKIKKSDSQIWKLFMCIENEMHNLRQVIKQNKQLVKFGTESSCWLNAKIMPKYGENIGIFFFIKEYLHTSHPPPWE